jgi:GNAT superfamily N-acetyltransferase
LVNPTFLKGALNMSEPVTQSVVVRKATSADRTEMIRLMKGYLDFYQRPYPEESKLNHLLDTLERQPERGLQFIAELDGKGIGFATLYSTFSSLRAQEAMVMNDLFVEPAYRGTGAGRVLFEACKLHVYNNGYAFMEWVTAADNETAQKFYERQGAERGKWVPYSI